MLLALISRQPARTGQGDGGEVGAEVPGAAVALRPSGSARAPAGADRAGQRQADHRHAPAGGGPAAGRAQEAAGSGMVCTQAIEDAGLSFLKAHLGILQMLCCACTIWHLPV